MPYFHFMISGFICWIWWFESSYVKGKRESDFDVFCAIWKTKVFKHENLDNYYEQYESHWQEEYAMNPKFILALNQWVLTYDILIILLI